MMSNLKRLAIEAKVPAGIKAKPIFHKTFTEIVEKYGRMYEPELYLKVADKRDLLGLFRNASLGLRLMSKGKISFKPPSTPDSSKFLSNLRNNRNNGNGGKKE
jgi:hypothetical protein